MTEPIRFRHPMTFSAPDRDRDGFVVRNELVPERANRAYQACWRSKAPGVGGWPDCTPYMRHSEVLDLLLCEPVYAAVRDFVGEDVGLHLVLSGWVSTERTWHQDSYLNPPYIGDGYVGLWAALEDVDPAAGPLEVVPGSHLWPALERDDVLARLEPEERADPDWPRYAERFVTGHWEREIAERGGWAVPFLGFRGDCLLWRPGLVHRGSPPAVAGTPRPAVIAHYSALSIRDDMPARRRHGAGWYFEL